MYGYIYLIVNKVNGKTYIGQHKSNNWKDNYMGSGVKLGFAKKKYVIENFEKFLIQYCETKEELNKQEEFWIAEYRSRGKAEYNIANGGDGGATCVGRKWSDEQRAKFKSSMKGRKFPGRRNKGQFGQRPAWNKGLTGLKGHPTNNGKKWWNNGVEQKLAIDCPDGWTAGRLGKFVAWNKGVKKNV